MIESFLASWALFGATYAVALLIAATLALVGVWIVARNQIFFGAAVAQASTLGVAIALGAAGFAPVAAGAWLESELFPTLLAVIGSLTTAWMVARAEPTGNESREAITGWVFLLAASLPVLLLAHSPHGLEEVHRLMFSTLLSASETDLAIFVALATLTALLAGRFRRPLVLLALDPEMAAAVGIAPRRWSGATALWLGLAVGLSIRASGMLYSFGCLVLPALVAKNLCREAQPVLALAPVVAVGAALAGLVIAHGYDLPPAHTTIAVLCGLLPLAWLCRAWRTRREASARDTRSAGAKREALQGEEPG